MKYLITILFITASICFGIDKKTPSGTTVNDKPGQNQSVTVFEPLNMTNSQATKLGLKEYLCDKTGGAKDITYNNGTKATVSLHEGVLGTLDTVAICLLMPYQTQSGSWRMRFNMMHGVSGTARTTVGIRLNGVSFSGLGLQSCSGNYGTVPVRVYTGSNDNYIYSQLQGVFGSVNSTEYWLSGDVSLASKPTWAY